MLELPPLLPAAHLSFSAGTSIPVSNSFCHFPSKKAALVRVVLPYLNMTYTNAGHGKAEVLSEVQEAVLKFFWRKIYLLVEVSGKTRPIGIFCLKIR